MILCYRIQAQGADLEDLAVLPGELLAGLPGELLDVLPDGHNAVLPGTGLLVGHDAVHPNVALPDTGVHGIGQQTEYGKTEICGHLP
ncbi:hypothetical protein CWO92_11435 [Heyndrickxia camelliae]|uniref:Uncharacterized protein n=1 Tax=Heyndrickxia camelliae TaxID=1707093 RepID=A0A2N3LK19_9BACI|nr:hypothetical protein CWO92_11435 [Heyndrickxia camelliae]